MANHLTTNLSFATTEQEHLDIHVAQAARFEALEALTPAVIAALVALVDSTAVGYSPVATEQDVADSVANHADLDTVHGAVAAADQRVAKLDGGGSTIFAHPTSTTVPVGESIGDIWVGPNVP